MATIKGGDKLDKALVWIAKQFSTASSVDVGFLADALYPDGTSVAMIAAIQEFGAPRAKIPPRPFFRTMIQKKSPEWPRQIAQALRDNRLNARKTLAQTGALIASELQQSIIEVTSPALSPVTVMLRGMRSQARYRDLPFWTLMALARERVASGATNFGASDKPLIDTGYMLRKVDYVVK